MHHCATPNSPSRHNKIFLFFFLGGGTNLVHRAPCLFVATGKDLLEQLVERVLLLVFNLHAKRARTEDSGGWWFEVGWGLMVS